MWFKPLRSRCDFERREETLAGFTLRFGVVAADADPGFDEGADEPFPNDALMVGAVALEHRADVLGDVAGRAGGEGTEANGGDQMCFDHFHHMRACSPCNKASGKPPTAKI